MTKSICTFVIGAIALLVSCEPLPVYPEDPYGRSQRGPDQRDPYNRERSGGSWERTPIPDGYTPPQRYAPPERQAPQEYPVAERTDSRNQVISPYAPYNVIDVEGFRSGQLAKDPSNGKIFRIP